MRDWSIDNVLRSISENLEDQDVFHTDPSSYLNATFAQLLEEGGESLIAQAIENEFAPMTVLSVNADHVIMSNFPGYGEYDDNVLARRKFKVPFSPDNRLLNWGVTQLMPALRGLEIERQRGELTPERHPLFFEGLDDKDEFAGECQICDQDTWRGWEWPAEDLQKFHEAHIAAIEWIRSVPHEEDRFSHYVDRMRELGFDRYMGRAEFVPIGYEQPQLNEAVSPFTGEETRDWGWQATVIPVSTRTPEGEGLDDVDEFFTGTDLWRVTITNKYYPGKELTGTVGWNYGDLIGHMPKVEDVERNDFPLISYDFARRLVWAVYWASEEEGEGRGRLEPFVIDQGNLLQVDRVGIEVLKHINDPSEIEKKYPHKPPGWSSVGTHTYGEAAGNREVVTVNGKPFVALPIGGFANLVMNTHWVSPTNHYEAGEEIAEAYDLFSYWGPTLNIADYENIFDNLPDPGPTPAGSLDDADEFEEDDPEIELQRQEDAERHAIRAGVEMMRKEFATLDKPGFEVIYLGGHGTFSAGARVSGLTVRPYVVIGRKKATVTEDLRRRLSVAEILTQRQIRPIPSHIASTHVVKPIEPSRGPGLDDQDEFSTEDDICPPPHGGWDVELHGPQGDVTQQFLDEFHGSIFVDKGGEPEDPDRNFDGCAIWVEIPRSGFIRGLSTAWYNPSTDAWVTWPYTERIAEGLDDKDEFRPNRPCTCSDYPLHLDPHDHEPWCALYEPGPEDLDDLDEFTEYEFFPVSATIIYNPEKIMRPAVDVIEIAKMIVVEYGYLPGEFTHKSTQPASLYHGAHDNKTRIFGTLEVDDALMRWIEDKNGQVELSSVGVGGMLNKYGDITLILERTP